LSPSTQLHNNTKAVHIANQTLFALRYSATFYLLSTLTPCLFLIAPVSYYVPHIRHFTKSSSSTAFLESKSQTTAITTTTLPQTSREDFDRKTRLKGTTKLPRPTAGPWHLPALIACREEQEGGGWAQFYDQNPRKGKE
jgi:hypothetical protein